MCVCVCVCLCMYVCMYQLDFDMSLCLHNLDFDAFPVGAAGGQASPEQLSPDAETDQRGGLPLSLRAGVGRLHAGRRIQHCLCEQPS